MLNNNNNEQEQNQEQPILSSSPKNNNDLLDIYPKNIIKVHQWDKKKNKPWWICF